MSADKTVCVVGLGYIGLPTAALLANYGYKVFGVDTKERVVSTINRGEIHIVEPDLDAFVRSAVNSGNLEAFMSPKLADVYLICVPTPFSEGGGVPTPNLDYVLSAARGIAQHLKSGDMVILESTCPVGTTMELVKVFAAEGVDVSSISIAYCPERVLPGKIMSELTENDRIVGGVTKAAGEKVAEFYRTFVKGEVLVTDSATAEMCKLTENSFRDVNIAFANELSMLCDSFGIDVWNLIRLANRHPRVSILQPGAGVGGHCIAVDPWFLVSSSPNLAQLIKSGREVNDAKTDWVLRKIQKVNDEFFKQYGRPAKVVCFGLAFKPDIDDLRESPAVFIVKSLQQKGVDVVAVEPNILEHENIVLVSTEEGARTADIIVGLVKHREFLQQPVLQILQSGGVLLDFCGLRQPIC